MNIENVLEILEWELHMFEEKQSQVRLEETPIDQATIEKYTGEIVWRSDRAAAVM